jgi:hypothetical protein
MYFEGGFIFANSKLIIQLHRQRKTLHKLKLSHALKMRRKYGKLYMLHKILKVKLHMPKNIEREEKNNINESIELFN